MPLGRRLVRAAALTAAVAVLLLLAAAPAEAKGDPLGEAHARGLAYLAAQGGDGPYPAGLAAHAVEAAHAAGLPLDAWPAPGRAAIDAVAVPGPDEPFLRLVRPAYAAALAGRLHDWKGEDLEARLRAGFDGTQFGDAVLLNDDIYAVLALLAGAVPAEDPAIKSALAFIASKQNADGGWPYVAGGASGTDTTAMVLLLAGRAGDAIDAPAGESIAKARSFILANQVPGAGFAETSGGVANCDSTAWALRVGVGGDALAAWPYLLGLQAGDGGFAYQPGQASNTLCSAEAVVLLGDALHGRAPAPSLDGGDRGSPSGPAIAAGLLLLAIANFRRT